MDPGPGSPLSLRVSHAHVRGDFRVHFRARFSAPPRRIGTSGSWPWGVRPPQMHPRPGPEHQAPCEGPSPARLGPPAVGAGCSETPVLAPSRPQEPPSGVTTGVDQGKAPTGLTEALDRPAVLPGECDAQHGPRSPRKCADMDLLPPLTPPHSRARLPESSPHSASSLASLSCRSESWTPGCSLPSMGPLFPACPPKAHGVPRRPASPSCWTLPSCLSLFAPWPLVTAFKLPTCVCRVSLCPSATEARPRLPTP